MTTTSRNERSKVHVRTHAHRAPASPVASLLLATLFGAAFPPSSEAARPVGEPQLERPTLHSLGAYWIIGDDPGKTASVRLEYRKVGATAWRSGDAALPRRAQRASAREARRADIDVPADGWLFAGSVLLLEPATAYELRVTLVDSQGRNSGKRAAPGICPPAAGANSGRATNSRRARKEARRAGLRRRPGHRGRSFSRPGGRAFRRRCPATSSCFTRELTPVAGSSRRAAHPASQSSGPPPATARP